MNHVQHLYPLYQNKQNSTTGSLFSIQSTCVVLDMALVNTLPQMTPSVTGFNSSKPYRVAGQLLGCKYSLNITSDFTVGEGDSSYKSSIEKTA